MKLSLDGLKNADWKQLAVDHGEKVGLAVAVLIAGVVLLTGPWSPYDAKRPELVDSEVDRAARDLRQSVWTREVREADVPELDVEARAKDLLEPVSPEPFRLVKPVFRPLNPMQELGNEPTWLPPEDVVADAETLLVRLKKLDRVKAEEAAEDDEQTDDVDSQFQLNSGGLAAGGFPGFDGGDESGGMSDYGKGMRDSMGGVQDEGPSGMENYGASMGGMSQMMGGEGGPGRPVGDKDARGRGVKVVAVRAVFPYRKQVQELSDSLGVPFADAERRLQLLELQVERQRAVPGPNPWAGPWEPVDRAAAEALLAEDAGDASSREIVSRRVTDPAITFPLLSRVYGVYTGKPGDPGIGTHPRISGFDLSVEDRAAQDRMLAKLKERAEAARQRQEAAGETGPRKRTFDRGGFDARAAEDELADGKQSDEDAALLAELKALGADDVLLLARYFDVAVEPGQAYRYRTRLAVRNPNFGLGAADVADASALEGEERYTPWSEPSPPARVPSDEYVFLADVRPEPGGLPEATLEVTQFSRQYGTLVRDKERVKPGELVAFEDRSAYLLDPVKGVYEKRGDYLFDTDQIVLDVFAPPADAAELHPDLNLSSRDLPPGRVLLLAGTGAVNEVDAAQTPVRTAVNRQVDAMRNALSASLQDKDAVPEKSSGGGFGFGGGAGVGDGYNPGGGGGRRRGGR